MKDWYFSFHLIPILWMTIDCALQNLSFKTMFTFVATRVFSAIQSSVDLWTYYYYKKAFSAPFFSEMKTLYFVEKSTNWQYICHLICHLICPRYHTFDLSADLPADFFFVHFFASLMLWFKVVTISHLLAYFSVLQLQKT